MTPAQVAPGLLSWAPDLDDKTREQAERTARLPFLAGHVALMPDAHYGIGATVGSVIPTRGAVVPAAVGVDIGCGMVATETTLTAADLPDDLTGLLDAIAATVPAGVGRGHEEVSTGFDDFIMDCRHYPPGMRDGDGFYDRKLLGTAAHQFGTLGSGNHFVEVCLDERDRVWTVLHSGSRGVGNKLAQRAIEKAKGLMRDWFIELEDPDLAYLVEGTPDFDAYIADMLWAQDYALANRALMADAVTRALRGAVDRPFTTEQVNCHHNFTTREQHGGKPTWVTRKGAIRAREGDLGVIPGSMGTATFVVRGRGNAASWHSCSHGAGRRMSRGQARRELDTASLEEAMTGRTWQRAQARDLLDEHPAAYKDVREVMAAQSDLVEVVHELHQVLNYKGT